MRKENDLMLNILANPDMSLSDLKAVGLTADNTSIESENTYKKHPEIQKMFSNEDGSFNDEKFHQMYLATTAIYNNLADDAYNENLIKQTSFHRDNIFAPVEQRRQGPDSQLIRISNPFRHTSSMVRVGEIQESPLSIAEIAQSQKVLTNPVGVQNGEDPIYTDSPEESFFTDFFKTRVLAQWDEDGIHIDPVTGQEVQHKKGDKKLNENGTFFYENLDGRDIYGRQVLNKMDTLTAESSAWNKYDFFDSDDKEQKSILGTTMKNLALVGSMFIPYVGPYITGLSIATQGAGMLAVLGKMLTGSESPILSGIEGWTKSVNRQTSKTEYAQQNMWCWENFIGLVGDALGQFKEQRLLFSKIPAIVKGKYGTSEEGLKELESIYTKKYNKIYENQFKNLRNEPGNTLLDIARSAQEVKTMAGLAAARDVKAYSKQFQTIGEILSKSYMTGVTVADTYGEAKRQGASDIEASLLTLGYGAGMAALLNTGVGEWLFPELRYNKMHAEALAKALVPVKAETETLVKRTLQQGISQETAKAKRDYAKNIFNIGKKAINDLYTGMKSTGEKTISNALANAGGEGVEEVTEEILADASKAMFNLSSWLRNDDTILDNNWWDKESGFNLKRGFDAYAMNFLGGFIGGGIAGLNLDNIKQIKNLASINSKSATQELIAMIRNGEIDNFLGQVDKMTLGSKNLSSQIIFKDGEYVYAQGTETDNQDLSAKAIIHNQVDILKNILKSNGIEMSSRSFLHQQTDLLEDVKFALLQNSKSADRYVQRYNDLTEEIVTLANQVQQAKDTMVGKDDSDHSKETPENKKQLTQAENSLKEAQKRLKDLKEGKHLLEFVQDALFEMSPAVSSTFIKPTFERYCEEYFHKKFQDISQKEKESVRQAYNNWEKYDKAEDIHIGSQIYFQAATEAADTLKTQSQAYLDSADNELLSQLSNFFESGHLAGIQNLMTQDSEEQFLSITSSAISEQDQILAQSLMQFLGEDVSEVINLNSAIEEVINNTTISPEDKVLQLQSLEKTRNTIVYNSLNSHIQDIINPYIKQGFIHGEDKLRLIPIIDNLIRFYQQSKVQILSEKEPLAVKRNLSQEEQNQLNQLNTQFAEYSEIITNLHDVKNKIQNLNNSPVEQNLQQFTKTIIGEDIDISQTLESVENLLRSKSNSIDNFILGDDLDTQLRHIDQMIQLYRSVLLGSQIDNGDYFNVFGLNKTVNEVAKKLNSEGYQELAEIDQRIVNVFEQDLNKLQQKIDLVRKLNAINQGQKLNTQKRVGLNNTYLFYNKFSEIVKYEFPDWKDKDKLDAALSRAITIQKHINSQERLSVSEEDQKKIESEMLEIEDSIYEVFQSNPDKLNNIEDFLMNFGSDLFEISNVILDENTDRIDTNSFIWWLATRVAVKSSVFHKRLAESILDDVAPIPTQELATYTNYASVVNGDVFSKFIIGYKKAVSKLWEDPQIREKAIDNLSPDSKQAWQEHGLDKDNPFISIDVPRWTNITLTEGIPGSGKTQAIFKQTLEILRRFHTEDGLLDNIFYIHAVDKKEAEVALDDKHLNLPKAKAMSVQELIEFISIASEREGIEYELNSIGELVSNRKIIEQSEGIPSIIFIDEVSNLDIFELDTINKYAQQYGITVLVAGDFDQNGKYIDIEYKGHVLSASLSKNNFIRSPKQGVSMRPANSQKYSNLVKVLWAMQHEDVTDLELSYYESEDKLCGDVVINIGMEEVDPVTGNPIPNYNLSDESSELRQKIDKMVSLAQQPIGIIYHDDNSELVEFCTKNYPGKFVLYKDNQAQGKEAQYFIIDGSVATNDFDPYIKDIYTGITRASEGSIIINFVDDYGGTYRNNQPFSLTSIKEQVTVKLSATGEAIAKYSKWRKQVLKDLIKDAQNLQYKKRSNFDKVQSSEPSSQDTQKPSVSYLEQKIETLPVKVGDTVYINNEPCTIQNFELASDGVQIVVVYNNPSGQTKKTIYSDRTVFTKPSSLSEKEINDIITQVIDDINIQPQTEINYRGVNCTFDRVQVNQDKSTAIVLVYSDGSSNTIDTDIFKSNNPKPVVSEWSTTDKLTQDLQKVKSIDVVYKGKQYTFYLEDIPFTNIKGESGKNNVVNILKRNICAIDINGIRIPFYMSTGSGGKKTVATGQWYPIFGISPSGWLNKGKESQINAYYDIELLKLISEQLNQKLGTGFENSVVGPMIFENDYSQTEVAQFLNRDLDPVENHQPDTITKFNENVQKVKNALDSTFEQTSQPVIGPSTENSTKLQEELVQNSIDPQKNSESNLSVDRNTGILNLMIMFYTFNSFTSGVTTDENGYPVQTGDDPNRHKVRNDSINGLIHLDQKSEHAIRKTQEYLEILKKIRSSMFHATDENDLRQKVLQILQDNNFDLSNLNSKFVLKVSAKPTKDGRSFGSLDGSGDYNRYDVSTQEKLEYTRGKKDRSKEVLRKYITCVFGDIEGNLLEVPLLSFTDPISILNKLYLYPDLSEISSFWETAKSSSDNVYEKLTYFKELLSENGLSEKYKPLVDLITIYEITDNGVYPLHDFVPSKTLKNLGPNIVANHRGHTTYEVEGFELTTEYENIEDVLKLGLLKSSQIMFSETSEVYDNLGNAIVKQLPNGETTSDLFKPGLPFILVTDDLSLGQASLMSTYIKQLQNPDEPKRVTLVYVQPPKVSIRRYLEYLSSLRDNKSQPVEIGNIKTAFELVSILLSDPEFTEKLQFVDKSGVIKTIANIVQEGLTKQGEELKEWLQKPIQALNGGLTPRKLFVRFLMNVMYANQHTKMELNPTNSKDINESNVKLIEEILHKNGKDGVYIGASRRINSNPIQGSIYEIQVSSQNDYAVMVDGELMPYKMHGHIDTSIFQGDFEEVFGDILQHLDTTESKSGEMIRHFYNDGSKNGFAKRYLEGTLFVEEKASQYQTEFGYALNILPLEIKEQFANRQINNESDLNAAYSDIGEYLRTNGYISITDSSTGKKIFTKLPQSLFPEGSYAGQLKFESGEPLTISQDKEASGILQISTPSGDVTYRVHYDNGIFEIRDTQQTTEQAPTVISEKTKEDLTELIKNTSDIPRSLKPILSTSDFEQFKIQFRRIKNTPKELLDSMLSSKYPEETVVAIKNIIESTTMDEDQQKTDCDIKPLAILQKL